MNVQLVVIYDKHINVRCCNLLLFLWRLSLPNDLLTLTLLNATLWLLFLYLIQGLGVGRLPHCRHLIRLLERSRVLGVLNAE